MAEPGPLQAVAPDIWRLTLPLPFALDHVHVYLLQDGAGWTVVDTGLNTSQARAVWAASLADLGLTPAALRQVLITHAHPDHFGLAGWLQAWAGPDCQVWLSPTENRAMDRFWRPLVSGVNATERYLLQCGLEPAPAAAVAAEVQRTGARTRPLPAGFAILQPGARLAIGQRCWEVIEAPGHSDGHLLLYDEPDRLLLCGDHVLATITPHIGRWPSGAPDPLGRYLHSLDALRHLPVRLALPGHRVAIAGWEARIDELLNHHAERLARTLDAVNDAGATVIDVAGALFTLPALSVHEMRFAVAETLAHLDYLVGQGKLRQADEPVWRFWRV